MSRPIVHRSPRYPFLSLPKAIERAVTLCEAVQFKPVTVGTVAKAWGYTEKSSGVSQIIAALKQYGLLVDSRDGTERRVQLRESAHPLLFEVDPDLPDRQRALKSAALAPAIFHDVWNRWPDRMPPEGELRVFLAGKSYSKAIVERLITNYRDTLVYAGLVGKSAPKAEPAEPVPLPVDVARRGSERNLIDLPVGDALTVRLVTAGGTLSERDAGIIRDVVKFATEKMAGA